MTQTNAAGTTSATLQRTNQRLQKRLDAKLGRRQKPKVIKHSKKEIIGTGFTMFGDESSPVTMVEFIDYQCPFCNLFHHETLKKIQVESWNGTKHSVRFVVRNYPLNFHPDAMNFARAVECTRKDLETNAAPFATKLLKEQHLNGVTMEKIYNWLQESASGMDASLIELCIKTGKRDAQIQKDIEEGNLFGVSGTPTFFIIAPDGTSEKIQGAVSIFEFRKAIDRALLKK